MTRVHSPAAHTQPGAASSCYLPEPGVVAGAAADAIKAAHREVSSPGITTLARERLGLPPEWKMVIWSMEGDHPDYWGQSVEGGICPPKERGKYKGAPDWKKATLKRKFIATDAEIRAHVADWERATGKCAPCVGTGWKWTGWGVETGDRYRPCKHCGWTGKAAAALNTATTANAVGTPEGVNPK